MNHIYAFPMYDWLAGVTLSLGIITGSMASVWWMATHPYVQKKGNYSYRYPKNPISWFFLAKRHMAVRELIPEGRNLDLGCGLFKVTSDSIGMDRKGWKTPDVDGSVLGLPFRDESFDSVTLLEVIEHFDPDGQDRILKEVHRTLKDDGIFILSMPNMSPFWSVPYRLIWSVWEHSVQHEYLHDHIGMIPKARLVRILTCNNFRILSMNRKALLDLIVICERL